MTTTVPTKAPTKAASSADKLWVFKERLHPAAIVNIRLIAWQWTSQFLQMHFFFFPEQISSLFAIFKRPIRTNHWIIQWFTNQKSQIF